MKRSRTPTLLGVAAGLALLLLAAHVLPGCSSGPEYVAIGFHYTTRPPTPRPSPTASEASAPTPSAAARP